MARKKDLLMTTLYRALTPFALFFLLSATPVTAQNFDAMSIDQLKSVVTRSHPSSYYVLASKLFDSGARDEAVFWFYAGQLRYRTHLACNPDLPADGDAALFSALSDVIGSEINQYAFRDIPALIATIDEVVAWDEDTSNPFAADLDCSAARASVLAGLDDLRAYLADSDETSPRRAAGSL